MVWGAGGGFQQTEDGAASSHVPALISSKNPNQNHNKKLRTDFHKDTLKLAGNRRMRRSRWTQLFFEINSINETWIDLYKIDQASSHHTPTKNRKTRAKGD